jgi:hypothetical protein
MSQNWTTREKDMLTARLIMEKYAHEQESDSLGLFEIVMNTSEKRLNFCLSGWVLILAKHFVSIYGASQGDFVTRRVITRCIIQDQTLH